MPTNYYPGYYFYAPRGQFEACGMFTAPHIISASICFILSIIFAVLYIKKSSNHPIKVYKISAVILTILEAIKMSHSFIYGDLYLDAWFPVSYCGLLIFALWFAGYGRSYLKIAGESFIAYGCPIAGIIFLIFPTTSLMSFPIWHYFSIYSLFFHGMMIFLAIVQLNQERRLSLSKYISYIAFVIGFSVLSIILNSIFNCNLMNLREPYNVPVELIQNVYSFSNWAYTLLVVVTYIFIPLIVALLANKIKASKQNYI